jgi:hypothetical protein
MCPGRKAFAPVIRENLAKLIRQEFGAGPGAATTEQVKGEKDRCRLHQEFAADCNSKPETQTQRLTVDLAGRRSSAPRRPLHPILMEEHQPGARSVTAMQLPHGTRFVFRVWQLAKEQNHATA